MTILLWESGKQLLPLEYHRMLGIEHLSHRQQKQQTPQPELIGRLCKANTIVSPPAFGNKVKTQ